MTKFFFNKNDRNNLELLPFGKFYLIFQMLILFINFYLFIFLSFRKKTALERNNHKTITKNFQDFCIFFRK